MTRFQYHYVKYYKMILICSWFNAPVDELEYVNDEVGHFKILKEMNV